VLRLDTARLTIDNPRARFSCITESFTWASLHIEPGRGRRGSCGYLLSFF
jgi:hypothetical protein